MSVFFVSKYVVLEADLILVWKLFGLQACVNLPVGAVKGLRGLLLDFHGDLMKRFPVNNNNNDNNDT